MCRHFSKKDCFLHCSFRNQFSISYDPTFFSSLSLPGMSSARFLILTSSPNWSFIFGQTESKMWWLFLINRDECRQNLATLWNTSLVTFLPDCGPGLQSNLFNFLNTTTRQCLLPLTSISAHSTFVAHYIHQVLGLRELHYYDFHYCKEIIH